MHLWSKRIGGATFEGPRGITVDSAGNVIVTGTFVGTVDFGPSMVAVGGQPSNFA